MTQTEELKSLVGGEAERRAVLEEIRPCLSAAHLERIGRILELIGWLLTLLEMKNLSIAKLRQVCFGNQTESARNVCGQPPKEKKTSCHKP